MNIFKKTIFALAISALAGGAMAQSAPAPAPAPEPEKSPITANVTVVNDYRYRGISQSNFKPAIQGGFDYAHESGFYIGNWNSSISWISDANRQATSQSPNTTEAYIAQNFTFGPVNGFVKFSYALTNLFGFYNSKGSYYPDLTVNYDTGFAGIILNGHVGMQKITNNVGPYDFSYTDWKLGITKDFGGGLSANVSYVGTNAKSVAGTPLYVTPNAPYKNLGKAGGLVSLTKTF